MWSIWNFSPHFLDGLCICLLLTWSNQIPFLKMTVLTTVLDWWLPFGLHRLPPNTIPSSSLNPFLIILAHAKFVVMTFKYNCLDWVLSDLKLCSPVFEDNHWIYIWLANLSPWGHGGKSPKNLKKKTKPKISSQVAWFIAFLGTGEQRGMGIELWKLQQSGTMWECGHRLPEFLVSQKIPKHFKVVHSFFFFFS